MLNRGIVKSAWTSEIWLSDNIRITMTCKYFYILIYWYCIEERCWHDNKKNHAIPKVNNSQNTCTCNFLLALNEISNQEQKIRSRNENGLVIDHTLRRNPPISHTMHLIETLKGKKEVMTMILHPVSLNFGS